MMRGSRARIPKMPRIKSSELRGLSALLDDQVHAFYQGTKLRHLIQVELLEIVGTHRLDGYCAKTNHFLPVLFACDNRIGLLVHSLHDSRRCFP